MFYVYVLKSKEFDRFYVGMTNNINRRLREHNKGKSKSTAFYKPWKLFFQENFETSEEARQREKFLKSGQGRQLIRKKWSGSSAG